jgi:hypothetical protein
MHAGAPVENRRAELLLSFVAVIGSAAFVHAAKMPPSIQESAREPIKYVGDVWTYCHQPYLCYWKGRFYLQYLSNLKEEHVPPGRTLIMVSKDSLTWSNPKVVFPKYALPRINKRYDDVGRVNLPAGTFSVMHQRMGFYVAPNGRLLTLAFYSFCPHPRKGPNNGQGLGRVVREVYEDGTFGPIYFIRYNRAAG